MNGAEKVFLQFIIEREVIGGVCQNWSAAGCDDGPTGFFHRREGAFFIGDMVAGVKRHRRIKIVGELAVDEVVESLPAASGGIVAVGKIILHRDRFSDLRRRKLDGGNQAVAHLIQNLTRRPEQGKERLVAGIDPIAEDMVASTI